MVVLGSVFNGRCVRLFGAVFGVVGYVLWRVGSCVGL